MKSVMKVSEALQEFVCDMDLKRNPEDGSQQLAGIETGFEDLDLVTSGLRRGSLVVIASRPSMGKTTLALNIASHVVLNSDRPVLMFPLERTAHEIAMKLISQMGSIEMRKLQTGVMDEAGRQAVNAAIERMKGFPLYIDESPAQSADEIKSACHEFISRHGKLGLIVIDDLQSIGSSDANEDGAERYERVMSSLKRLASETDTPVILLSRLSALLDEREDKRPRISDLPDRAIAQWSDLLMFLHREELYIQDCIDAGTAELNIGRNRHGPIGTISLGTKKLHLGEFSNRA